MAAVLATIVGMSLAPKHLAVFGASGGCGSEATYQALERGYKVSVLCRDPSKLCVPPGSGGSAAGTPFSSPSLRVCQGDVTKAEDVSSVFTGADPVDGCIVALGGRTSDVGETMLTDGTLNIITAMKEANCRRISVITSIGAGDSKNQAPFVFRVAMALVLRKVFQDKERQEALFLADDGPGRDLEWTIVRPGGLTLGPPTGRTQVITSEATSISRADVAAFCIRAVTEDDWSYLKQAPAIVAAV